MYMNNINGMVSKSSTVKLPSVSVSSIDLNTVIPGPVSQETWFTGRNMITLGLLLLILALLGMNIFSYLGEGVDIFGSILQKLGIGTAKAAQDTVDVSMDGVKLGADIAAGGVKDVANLVKSETDNTADSKKTVSKAIDDNSDENDNGNESVNNQDSSSVNEDQSSDSTIQSRRSNKKSGWCYVGTDRKVRSCIQVNASNKCMSGDIFPSRELCINPSLRS